MHLPKVDLHQSNELLVQRSTANVVQTNDSARSRDLWTIRNRRNIEERCKTVGRVRRRAELVGTGDELVEGRREGGGLQRR